MFCHKKTSFVIKEFLVIKKVVQKICRKKNCHKKKIVIKKKISVENFLPWKLFFPCKIFCQNSVEKNCSHIKNSIKILFFWYFFGRRAGSGGGGGGGGGGGVLLRLCLSSLRPCPFFSDLIFLEFLRISQNSENFSFFRV